MSSSKNVVVHEPLGDTNYTSFRSVLSSAHRRLSVLVRHHGLLDRLRWSLQFALVGCLPAALLIHSEKSASAFTPPTMIISFIIVTTAPSCGQGVSNLVLGLKIALLSYAMVSAVEGIDCARNLGLWTVCLLVGTFSIAYFTEFVVTMNTMLMFVIGMMYNFIGGFGGRTGDMYSSYQVRDVLCGIALGVLTSLIPIRLYNIDTATDGLRRLSTSTNAALSALLEAFFADTNAQRVQALMVARREKSAMAVELAAIEQRLPLAWFEPVNGLRVAELEVKCVLFRSLLGLMMSTASMVEELRPKMGISHAVEVRMREAKCRLKPCCDAVRFVFTTNVEGWCSRRKSSEDEEGLRSAAEVLLSSYAPAIQSPTTSRQSLRDHVNSITGLSFRRTVAVPGANDASLIEMIELSPLMRVATVPPDEDSEATATVNSACGFLVYHLHTMVMELCRFTEPEVWTTRRKVANMVTFPLRELLSIRDLVKDTWNGTSSGRGKEKLKFAVKLACCMTGFCTYLLQKEVGDPFFGPAQMAFAAGLDSSLALNVFASQVIGSIVGTAAGFLISSACHTPLDYIVATVVGGLVTGFFRSSSNLAVVAIYVQFAFFGALRPWTDANDALTSILTNTAAMGLYVLCQVLVLPADPRGRLKSEMVGVLTTMGSALRTCHNVLLQTSTRNASFSADHHAAAPVVHHCEKCVASIRMQEQLVPSAESQPSLDQTPFPSHLVHKVVQRELELVSIIEPLSRSWQRLVDGGLDYDAPTFAFAVSGVSSCAERMISVLVELLADTNEDSDVAYGARIAAIHAELQGKERLLLDEFAALIPQCAVNGSIAPVDVHLLDTSVYCMSVLPEYLFELFRCVSDFKSASKWL